MYLTLLLASANLAGMLIIGGGLLGWLCWRNICVPPPHYENAVFARWALWLGLFGALALLCSGVLMAVQAWQIQSQLPAGPG